MLKQRRLDGDVARSRLESGKMKVVLANRCKTCARRHGQEGMHMHTMWEHAKKRGEMAVKGEAYEEAYNTSPL